MAPDAPACQWGGYRAGVAYGVAVQEGVNYDVVIVAEKAGNRATWRVRVTAQARSS